MNREGGRDEARAPKKFAVASWAQGLTILGAEVAYLCLAVYLVWITFGASSGQTPGVSTVTGAAAGALATAFGVGYATVLQPQGAPQQQIAAFSGPLSWLRTYVTVHNLLAVGIFLYMAAGLLLGIAYVSKSAEAPAVVRTIAIAFGGYVIGYLGVAYRNYSD